MAKLTNDIARTYELGDIEEFPVLAGEKICEGAAVGIDSNGYARSLQAGDKFGGFADEASDNSSGQDGSRTVRVKYKGTVVITAPSGITQANVGNYLYASDDNIRSGNLRSNGSFCFRFIHSYVSFNFRGYG